MDVSIGSYKMRLDILILIFIAFWIILGHLLCSCSTFNFKEGMQVAGTINFGGSKEGFSNNDSLYKNDYSASKSPDWIMNPDSWSNPALRQGVNKNTGKNSGNTNDRKPQQIPLPEGQLGMFNTTEFKPECCPNSYSNSTGCACMTVNQLDYLKNRGGNNVQFSEY